MFENFSNFRDSVDGFSIRRSPVEGQGQVVFPIIYRVSAPSNRWLGMGFQPSTVGSTASFRFWSSSEVFWVSTIQVGHLHLEGGGPVATGFDILYNVYLHI